MTEMKLTRNSDFPWIKILFKKIDENRKKLVSIKKYYNKKRRSLGYRNNNEFIMNSNIINNDEHVKVCMLNAKGKTAELIFFPSASSFERMMPPRPARSVLCVVEVTTCACGTGFGCTPAATRPEIWAISTIR